MVQITTLFRNKFESELSCESAEVSTGQVSKYYPYLPVKGSPAPLISDQSELF